MDPHEQAEFSRDVYLQSQETERAVQEALREFVDTIAPEHDRTSCPDREIDHEDCCELTGNQYSEARRAGFPRCCRCALLHYLREGEFPYGAQVRVSLIEYR